MHLPFTFTTTTPSSQMHVQLEYVGLGKKKIVFAGHDKNESVIKNIYEAFPRLKECRFFTLHKATTGGNQRPLRKLEIVYYDINKLRSLYKAKSLI